MRIRRLATLAVLSLAIVALMVSPAGVFLYQEARTAAATAIAGVEGGAFNVLFPGASELGPLPTNQVLDVGVGVPMSNAAGLQAFIQSTSTVGSPDYRQFLTASQFESQYSPSASAYQQDVQYFEQFGVHVQPSGNRLLLGLTGTPAQMGAAFHTQFAEYRLNGETYYGTTTTATLPSDLAISGTFGLTSAFNAKPSFTLTPLTPSSGSTASPASPQAACSGGDTPTQVWDAYRVNVLRTAGQRGSGMKIAVVDAYDTSETPTQLTSDLNSFDSSCGVGATTPQYQYPVPFPSGVNSSASSNWGGETALDMQWSHAMADQATLRPVQTPDSGYSLYAAVNYLVTTMTANVVSLSWGLPDVGVASGCTASMGCNASTGGAYELLHPVIMAAVAEGITVTVASGDCGAADGSSTTSTDYPASDEDSLGVGGTVLTLATNGTWIGSETGWSGNLSGSSCTNAGGAGGGWAPVPQPWYQTGHGIRYNTLRGVPDVGITVGTPLVTFVGGIGQGVYGTSDGAPQWAGLIAVADGIAGHGLGLVNPNVYAMLRSSSYTAYFHNITSGNNGYAQKADWGPVSGVGTPVADDAVRYIAAGGYTVNSTNLIVGLSASTTSGATPLTVTFTVSATGGSGKYVAYNYYWGDGTSIETHTPVLAHTYSSAGTYAAQVEVYDTSGNSSLSQAVMITAGATSTLSLNLAASTTSPTVGQSVTFTATATGGTSPYVWGYYFGDGSYVYGGYSSGSASPNTVTHTFEQVGTFCADATVNDSSNPKLGATSNLLTIHVGGAGGTCPGASGTPLSVTSTATPVSGNAPLTVSFTATPAGGSGTYTTWAWTFGDGGTSAVQSPSHTYTTTGTFSAVVTVTDSLSNSASSAPITITVSAAGSLTATATPSVTSGTAPLAVTFTGSASGGTGPYTYYWNFGDGTTGSTTQNPAHTYAAAGTYTAKLTVNDSASHTITVSATPITVSAASSPTVTATATPQSGAAPLSVAFTATPSGGTSPYTYLWNFGDTTTSTSQNPTHVYSAVGTYSAKVTVTDSASRTGTSSALTITVSSTAPLTATATVSPTSGTAPLAVTFTGSASGGTGPYTYFWVFMDGSHSNLQSPSHTYTTAGTYTATLTVNDSASGTKTVSAQAVTVSASQATLQVTAAGNPLSGNSPLTVAFTSSPTGGSGNYVSYAWSFGDTTTSTLQNPSHTYTVTTARTFNATVTVTDSQGHTATSGAVVISVSPSASPGPLIGNLTVSPTTVAAGSPVTFTAAVSGGTPTYSFSWSDLPPGCVGTNVAVVRCSPSVGGTYLVSVLVSDSAATPASITRYTNLTVTGGTGPSSTTPSSTILGMDPVTFAVVLIAIIAVAALGVALIVHHRRRKVPPSDQMPEWNAPGGPGGPPPS